MTRTVFCRKYQAELEGLTQPPLPGAKGELIFETVSRKAWTEWQAVQTMLINERNLRLIDPEARQYLAAQMEKFLDNEPIDKIEGYRPPDQI